MSEDTKFPHTIEALRVFDARKPELDLLWAAAKTDDEVDELLAEEKEAEIQVQTAFYEDTKDRHSNSLDNCKMLDIEYIRYSAGLPLSEGIISLGGTIFGELTGETTENGEPKWRHHSLMGDPRVKLLQDVREGRTLPEGLILLGQLRGSTYVPIKAENVAWESWTGHRR
jgi:hypothetical protein